MKGRAALRLGIAVLALVLSTTQGSVARAATPATDTLHLLVHFAAGTSAAERAAAVRAVGGTIEAEIAALGVTRVAVTIERGTDPNAVLRAIGAQPAVKVVENDARVYLDYTPNDPYWNTDPLVGLGQWGERKIGLDRALDLVGPLTPITVAVIDTGVDAGHPDLLGVVLPGTTILSSESTLCNADAKGTDDNSHGTHVTGIIAANANNGIGIAGVAPNARILPIKALDCTGSGSVFDIALAIAYAVDQGARVINISLGSSMDSPTLEAAVAYAVAHNVLIVAAAGNCGQLSSRCFNQQNLVEYPGASPGVLGVGATALDDTIASFSTQGPQVGLSAPGVRIVSTTPRYPTYQSDRGSPMLYAAFSGTSQATPFVTGAAALLLGMDPSLSARQVADRLKTSAVDLGAPGTDPAFGAGRLDLLHAVTATLPSFSARYDTSFVPRAVATGATFTARVAVTNTSRVAWSSASATPVRLSYHWIDANGTAVVWEGVRTSFSADVQPGATATVDMAVRAPAVRGAYTLRVDLVLDGVAWFSERGVAAADVRVFVDTGANASYALPVTAASLQASTPSAIDVTLTNTGFTTWAAGGAAPVHLSYHWLSLGSVVTWDGARAGAFPADVPPGGTVTVPLLVIPPPEPGWYTLRLDLVEEGVRWFSEAGVAPRDIPYQISTGYGASYSPATTATSMRTTGPSTLSVLIQNTGSRTWSASGPAPVHLSYHWVHYGVVTTWDGARAPAFARDVPPGGTVAVELLVTPPAEAGVYTLRLDLVQEGVAWFSDEGVATSDVRYIVSESP